MGFLYSIGATGVVDEDALEDAALYTRVNCLGAILWCTYICVRHWAQGMQATSPISHHPPLSQNPTQNPTELKTQEMDGQMCWLAECCFFLSNRYIYWFDLEET